jgi:hypothetical protein
VGGARSLGAGRPRPARNGAAWCRRRLAVKGRGTTHCGLTDTAAVA